MLKGKVAIVTGGTRGIGYAIVETFLKNGAKVALMGSRQSTVDAALEKLHSTDPSWDVMGLWPALDDYAEVQLAFDQVREKFGRVDILVNNAGVSAREPIYDYEPDAFKKIMDLNVTAAFLCSKAAAPIMRAEGGGSIINTSSMVSLYGQPSGVGYPTSKFAVNGITLSLAREYGPKGIRVNAVAPGIIETDMMKAVPKELIDPMIAQVPLRRLGQPQDIANAFLFLASDEASYITGMVLSVDGLARS